MATKALKIPDNKYVPARGTRLEYRIASGQLKVVTPDGRTYTVQASSGRGGALNDPTKTHIKSTGPIPAGSYTLSTSELSDPLAPRDYVRNAYADWGDWRVPVHPQFETNRTNMMIHGGSKKGTIGCIDVGGGTYGSELTDQLRDDILADPDGVVELEVLER